MTRDQAYHAYETLLRSLHVLIALGMGDGYEADLLREAMEGYSKELNDEDIQRLNDLSGDLYDQRRRKDWMKKYIWNEPFICGLIGGAMLGFAAAMIWMAL